MESIRSNVIARILYSLIAAALCFGCVPANADSQGLMDRMLETYLNVTPGQAFETQRRGGITFGSVISRSRVVTPNIIAIQPPSFRGSCSGFDLIGGSFSFLNGEQLQQFLRSIASNALNYAFTLALEGVCPTCMQQMAQLRNWSDAINSKLMDSCHWGEQLVNATRLDDWQRSQKIRAQNGETLAGVVEDFFKAAEEHISPLISDRRANKLTSQNVVMAAMRRSNMQTWFGAVGNQELLEVAMSVTGTVVKRPRKEGESCANDAGDEDYCLESLADTIDVEQFINGSDKGPVSIWRCRDYPECLDIYREDNANWPGLKRRIQEIMFGPAPSFSGGLVEKFINPVGATFTEAEQRFVQGAPAPVLALLEGVQKYQGSVRSMAEQLTEVITVQIARDLMMQVVTNVEKAFQQTAIQMSAVMLERISRKMEKFLVNVTYEDREFDNMAKLIHLMQEVKKQIREQEPAQAPKPVAMAGKGR